MNISQAIEELPMGETKYARNIKNEGLNEAYIVSESAAKSLKAAYEDAGLLAQYSIDFIPATGHEHLLVTFRAYKNHEELAEEMAREKAYIDYAQTFSKDFVAEWAKTSNREMPKPQAFGGMGGLMPGSVIQGIDS